MGSFISYYDKQKFIPVDNWIPDIADKVFKHSKGYVYLDVASFYGIEDGDKSMINYFMLSPKRCYNSIKMRDHIVHYLNYFEKFYDQDRELPMIYRQVKFMMDYKTDWYTREAFLYDLKKYILSGSILYKLKWMNQDNYNLSLNYRNKKDPVLQYTDKHGMMLMLMSILMVVSIPLITHYAYRYKIYQVNDFLLEIYDNILHMFDDVDIYTKLYETSLSNINKNRQNNPLWEMQDIRGKNITTHSLYSVENIILNIMPKYLYDENIIHFNYQSIVNNTGYQITDIGYEYNFVQLSSSKRDMDNNSEFDKFESYLTKADESLYLQIKTSAAATMKNIEMIFGPFDSEEVEYYINRLSENDNFIINPFQKDLIFNLFYKYFGDSITIKAINREDYVKLIIAAKRILNANNLLILPYIISSKVNRLVSRKSLNKKELSKISMSPYYTQIVEKYKNEKIEKYILSIIATILSSEFQIIDYNDDELDGKIVESFPDIICEEILMYVSLI